MISTEKIFKIINPFRLAKALKITRSVVYAWKYNNKIPSWRVPQIKEACVTLGIDISDCEVSE